VRDIGGILKKAQKMQADMARVQEELSKKEVDFSAGGGMVNVRMNGRQELVGLKIDKSVVDPNETEMLEDLIMAAVNGARQKADELARGEMAKITAGLPLPPGVF
jgi:hypothetical protein